MIEKYDLHVHTYYSPCSVNKPETVLKMAKRAGLTGIAITDHNEVEGAKQVKNLNKDKAFEVIVGEEIRTSAGDMIALYIQEPILTKDLFDAIDQVKAQDGIIIIPHPFRMLPWRRFGYPIEKLVGKADAVEIFNSRNFKFENRRAEEACRDLDFAKVASSDAHFPADIGKAKTLFSGSLRQAIEKRKTQCLGTNSRALISSIMASAKSKFPKSWRVRL